MSIFSTRLTILSLTMALSIFLTGCHILQNQPVHEPHYSTDQPTEFFISDLYSQMPAQRIVLMIPRSQENHYELNSRLVESLRRHLARLGIFDVVLTAGVCDVTLDSIRKGTFDERRLWEITKRYHADGIMLCEAFSFSAYEPLKLGCSLTFVDTRESIVTIHTSGVWDCAQHNVFKKFQQHVCRVHRCKHYAADVFLKSPSEFIDFVANDLADSLHANLPLPPDAQFEQPQAYEHWDQPYNAGDNWGQH